MVSEAIDFMAVFLEKAVIWSPACGSEIGFQVFIKMRFISQSSSSVPNIYYSSVLMLLNVRWLVLSLGIFTEHVLTICQLLLMKIRKILRKISVAYFDLNVFGTNIWRESWESLKAEKWHVGWHSMSQLVRIGVKLRRHQFCPMSKNWKNWRGSFLLWERTVSLAGGWLVSSLAKHSTLLLSE